MIRSPSDISGVDTRKRNRPALQRLYRRGVRDGAKLLSWMQ